VLHVTNGDSTTATMERARIGGDLLAWRDVLHEGPVPALPPAELRRVRAEYLSTISPLGATEIEAALLARDERLDAAIAASEPVVLWFEHDLYDQLQLIQVLAGLPDRPTHVALICIGSFPGRPAFKGLGELEPDELASTSPRRCAGCWRSCRARATASAAASATCSRRWPRARARARTRSWRPWTRRRRRSWATSPRSSGSARSTASCGTTARSRSRRTARRCWRAAPTASS
jgi:hypothetical protein